MVERVDFVSSSIAAVACCLVLGGCVADRSEPSAVVSASTAPAREVLWDGEAAAVGVGWVSPQPPTADPGSHAIAAVPGRGFGGTAGVVWDVAIGEAWVEAGWRWVEWWPPDAARDLTGAATLRFRFRVEGAPPGDFAVRLDSGPEIHKSHAVSLKAYAPAFADGAWHDVAIPMADLTAPADSVFEPAKAIELFLGAWNPPGGRFAVAVDDVAVER